MRVVFSDDGPGIPPGQESQVVERVAQGGSQAGGLGLGLAICRAIMRLHGGVIWVRNKLAGHGAEFHIEFPRPAAQPEAPRG
ncbi:sensor histidine kinase [Pseudomonas aeruginosa]|uniref:sensor histidine kinase n=1 Tax=Pseudomonas aeruginosa TaxID=287 RepID=UPI003C6E58E1